MTPDARAPLAPPDLRRRLTIETPEHVRVHLELAGLGSRTAAALVDILVVQAAVVVGVIALALLRLSVPGGTAAAWTGAVLYLAVNFALLAYFALFEALGAGRTLGKRLLGIRVVMDTGRPITPTAAVVRTLLRLVDTFFPLAPFLPGMIAIAVHPDNKRLGDLAAGTLVVRDRPTEWGLSPTAEPVAELLDAGPPQLSDAEFRLLDRFLARLSELDPPVARRMAQELASRWNAGVAGPRKTPLDSLVHLFADEQRRRQGRFGTRARPGPAGRTTVAAERFVARKRAVWEEFYDAARHLERAGLAALPADDIPSFAANYREVAADLARAHTYGLDPAVIEYLERLVGAGHNVLYGARRRRRPQPAALFLRAFPAAVVSSWRYVATALLLFAAPAAVGYALLREDPSLAERVVSPVLVSRAEQAAARRQQGLGYVQESAANRPGLAALLISNNVLVCFYVFAGGLLAGTWTVLVLMINGLSLGIACGLFANYHALGYLLTFVAGHGVLELTAIFISAGAGLRLARALIAPGDLRRRDALVREGRVAARMVAVVVCMLVLAGAIEGLLSASEAAPSLKMTVSGASALLLILYFANGWRHWRRREDPGDRDDRFTWAALEETAASN